MGQLRSFRRERHVHLLGRRPIFPSLSPRSGDIPTPRHGEYGTLWLQARLDQYRAAGLPVLVIDYCVNEQHRLECYQLSRARGYVPFVSRTPLDRLPSPPPP